MEEWQSRDQTWSEETIETEYLYLIEDLYLVEIKDFSSSDLFQMIEDVPGGRLALFQGAGVVPTQHPLDAHQGQ